MYETDTTPGWKRWRNRTVGPQRVHTPDPALQPALDFTRSARPTKRDDLTIQQRFLDWSAANPSVLRTLRRMALDRVAAGDTRISAKELVEELRRAPLGLDKAGERYRIDNSFTRCIARALNDDPRLAGLIELRATRAE